MPDLETVTGALREINPDVKLMISSAISPGQLPAPLRLPPHVFLPKPCQTAVLLDTLRHILANPPPKNEDGIAGVNPSPWSPLSSTKTR